MARLVKRRAPLVIGSPASVEGPSFRVPRIGIVGRVVPIIAGVVLAVHPPHGTATLSAKVPDSSNVVLTSTFAKPSIIRVFPPKIDLPRLSRGKVSVILNTYKQNGTVVKEFTPRNTLPRIRGYSSKSLGRSSNRPGAVIRIKPPLSPPAVTVRVGKNRTIFNSYNRVGQVSVSRHSFRVVVPVTTVRPKPSNSIPDINARRRLVGYSSIGTWIKGRLPIPKAGNVLLVCVNITETWAQHFSARGWNTIQDQLDAGYPFFAEPSLTTGSYQEVFDFGLTYNNVIVTVNWSSTILTGSVTTTCFIETSIDGISWTPGNLGSLSAYASTMRYARVTLSFAGGSDKSLMTVFNLKCTVDVKRETDGGNANVLAADATGTLITFTKTFKAIDAITVTPKSTTEKKAIVNFDYSLINPTTFRVLAFDNTGTRVDATVGWVARGII
jgi:hypothetical protein